MNYRDPNEKHLTVARIFPAEFKLLLSAITSIVFRPDNAKKKKEPHIFDFSRVQFSTFFLYTPELIR